jgi:catechol 1,2-dioxygenase
MIESTRRHFLGQVGLAAAGGALVLRADAGPTPATENVAVAETVLKQLGPPPETVSLKDGVGITDATTLGPAYRSGAPFRGKVCPPFEPGDAMVVSGRVWAHDTRRPLPGAMLDVWQVDIRGKYSAGNGEFKNRTRVVASESGYYEFETIHPVGYRPSWEMWRSAHIHFKVTSPGYRPLVTELFFEGDPKHDEDPIFLPSLRMPVKQVEINGKAVQAVVFDVVLPREA